MYNRILLKVSGEVLMGKRDFGIDVDFAHTLSEQIAKASDTGVQIALVIGGGNIFRGVKAASNGMVRGTADYIGMLATVMNGVALKDALEKQGKKVRVMSALNIPELAEPFIRQKGIRHLEKDRIVILVSGTGNPYFTTDSAAVLRACELDCDIVLKATKVDGVYDKDPNEHDDAIKYDTLSFTDALSKNLKIMDASALSLARDNDIPVRVFSLQNTQNVCNVLHDANMGTTIR